MTQPTDMSPRNMSPKGVSTSLTHRCNDSVIDQTIKWQSIAWVSSGWWRGGNTNPFIASWSHSRVIQPKRLLFYTYETLKQHQPIYLYLPLSPWKIGKQKKTYKSLTTKTSEFEFLHLIGVSTSWTMADRWSLLHLSACKFQGAE